jgi:transcriptional regulator with GAF, ATPase, and Fis domain
MAGSGGPSAGSHAGKASAGPAGTAQPLASWIAGFGIGEPAIGEIVAALRPAGIDLVPHDETAPLPPTGIVAFAAITDELCEFVREASHTGTERILGLLVSAAAADAARLWDLLHAGSADVMPWDGRPDHVSNVNARLRRWRAVDDLVGSPLVRGAVVGEDAVWRSVLREVVEVGRFTNASVLITGESGTGKEMVARLIHDLDKRPKKGKLVVLDCTTVVPSLSGSEFFGHDRGAYTGAVSAREGAFELADGGTLFLDEVGELPAPMQAELLRVVQEGTFKRVGSNLWRKSEFRLICATNRNLADEQKRGTFRSDFYYRIASWKLQLPSLKDRADDIVPLFRHFYRQHRPEGDQSRLDDAVHDLLLRREYPGNVRDLRNLAFRVSQRHVGDGPVTVGDLPEEEWPAPGEQGHGWRDQAFERCIRKGIRSGATLREITAGTSETAIGIALADEGGNLHRAARRLGVTDRALQLRRAAGRDRQSPEAAQAESAASAGTEPAETAEPVVSVGAAD